MRRAPRRSTGSWGRRSRSRAARSATRWPALASLGGTGAYIDKVCDDFLGQVYRHDITAAGIRFDTPAATSGPGTARCLILVTPDGQRTMSTYLGACADHGPADIDPDVIV